MATLRHSANALPAEWEYSSSARIPNSDAALSVLFVTDRLDAPFRYRCVHPCLLLRAEGVSSDISRLEELDLLSVTNYSVLILFRLPWSEKVELLVEIAKKNRVAVIFDIDDLIFDPKVIPNLPFWDTVSLSDKSKYINLSRRLAKTFEACEGFIGATPTLVAAAKERGKEAFEFPNLLHPSILRASPLVRGLRKITATRPVISYMSGSATHDLDFMRIAPTLRRILSERRDAVLLIGGFLDLRDYFDQNSSQVIRLPFVDWYVLPWVQSIAWANVAPLAKLDQFSHSKSALKFFEAGILGVPTVASPSAALSATIRNDENGYLAQQSGDWYERILSCLDWDTSTRLGNEAVKTSYAEHTFQAHPQRLSQALSAYVHEGWSEPKNLRKSALELRDPLLRDFFPGRSRQSLPRVRSILGVLSKSQNLEKLRKSLPRLSVARTEQWTLMDPVFREIETQLSANVLHFPSLSSHTEQSKDGWEVAWQLGTHSTRSGAWESLGTDPCLLGPERAFFADDYRFLMLDAEFSGDGDISHAQLYWLRESDPTYSESESVIFPVLLDGERHTYVVDLYRSRHGNKERSRWNDAGKILRLRFDPMERPGSFQVHGFSLYSQDLLTHPSIHRANGRENLLDELAHGYLHGEGAFIGRRKQPIGLSAGAEILHYVQTPELLASDSLDFCYLDGDSPNEVIRLMEESRRVVRAGGSLFLVWNDSNGEHFSLDFSKFALLERFVQASENHFRHILLIKVL